MQKVMLIGDSIRQNYESEVCKLLANKATVTAPTENCRFSAYTLFRLSFWVPDDDFDVIHWNNGQWDTSYMPDGKIHTPLPVYLEFQERIFTILQKKAKRVIFATTTPVWPEMHTQRSINPRRNEDICEYNSAVTDLLRKHSVEINDLHSCMVTNITKYISDDMVHLTEEGICLSAKHVADTIMRK